MDERDNKIMPAMWSRDMAALMAFLALAWVMIMVILVHTVLP